jgi:hypothetical protein
MAEPDDEFSEIGLDEQIKNWRAGISFGPVVRVEVLRIERGLKPMLVGVLDGLPDEEQLHAEFGGGRYTLRVKAPDKHGRLVYHSCATISLAGDPRDPAAVAAVQRAQRTELQEIVEAAVADALAPVIRRLQRLERSTKVR